MALEMSLRLLSAVTLTYKLSAAKNPEPQPLNLEGQLIGSRLRLALRDLTAPFTGDLQLSALQVDDTSVLENVTAPVSPELADNPSPGIVQGNGAIISGLTQPLDVGAVYLVSYEILENSGLTKLFIPENNGSPFSDFSPPQEVGVHHILVVAQDDETKAPMRMSGTAEFGFISFRKAEWEVDLPPLTAGQNVTARASFGTLHGDVSLFTPTPGTLYVAPDGSDVFGTGALQSPFRQPAAAAVSARAGDTVYLRPGIYDPFSVQSSGTESAPVTFTTLPGEERQAIITGVSQTTNIRGGIEIAGRDYVHIRNLLVEDMPRDGIHIRGVEGEQHGHHVISNCLTRRTGNSGIFVCGYIPTEVLPPETPRTIDILVEGCDVSETNIVTEFNAGTLNSLGEAGGVNESITVAGGVDGIIVRDCDVHDSRQYGIDYKHSVSNGEISGNRVWNVQRYGIYLDTNRRVLKNIAVFGNTVWQCGSGIVLAREADFDPIEDADGADMLQALINITVYNNVVFDIQKSGIFLNRHGGDSPHGEITNVRVSFNTAYNCGLSGSGNEARLIGWAEPDFTAAEIVSGIEFIGNLLWQDHGAGASNRLVNRFDGHSSFTVRDNYDASDPLFVDVVSRPPNLGLQPGSPAEGSIDISDVVSPFERTADGALRATRLIAGAF